MEPESSLPSLQELSTCTYPEPNQSSPQHSIPCGLVVRIPDYLPEAPGWIPVVPDLLRSESGMGPTQPHEDKLEATWKKY
jgi:hypothetical protein